MLPTNIKDLVDKGKKQLEEQRCKQKEELDRLEELRKKDEIIAAKKSWNYLCVEAKIELDEVCNFVNWNMPKDWKPQKTHWFFVKIHDLSDVVAEYECYNKFEWRFTRWAVTHFYGSQKVWVIYDRSHDLSYVLAVAKEQCNSKVKIVENDKHPCKKCKHPILLAYDYCVHCGNRNRLKISDIEIEEIHEETTVLHQAVS